MLLCIFDEFLSQLYFIFFSTKHSTFDPTDKYSETVVARLPGWIRCWAVWLLQCIARTHKHIHTRMSKTQQRHSVYIHTLFDGSNQPNTFRRSQLNVLRRASHKRSTHAQHHIHTHTWFGTYTQFGGLLMCALRAVGHLRSSDFVGY